jgi:hypothetical protein
MQSGQSDPRQLRWVGLAMLAMAAVFPLFGGSFFIRLAIEALLLGTVALSVDILLGYAGLLSLGQAAYFGLAAYISALMYLHVTQSFWLVSLVVVTIVGVFSLVIGAVAIRAKGVYFALITFGTAEILSKIAHNTRAINQSISSCTYSPDRNPDELVWKHLRADTVGRMTITDKADFKAKVRASMCQLQNDPEKIRTKNYRSNMPPDSAFTYGLINN